MSWWPTEITKWSTWTSTVDTEMIAYFKCKKCQVVSFGRDVNKDCTYTILFSMSLVVPCCVYSYRTNVPFSRSIAKSSNSCKDIVSVGGIVYSWRLFEYSVVFKLFPVLIFLRSVNCISSYIFCKQILFGASEKVRVISGLNQITWPPAGQHYFSLKSQDLKLQHRLRQISARVASAVRASEKVQLSLKGSRPRAVQFPTS